MRFLVVDDHAIVRRGLRELLLQGFTGAIVEEADDVPTAAASLAARPPSLVVLDLSLPGRSGLDWLRELRQSFPSLPVVVLSAFSEDEFAVQCLRAGANAYLTKGRAPEELLAAVGKALAGGRYVTASIAERLAALVGGDVGGAPHEALSPRELQVLRLVASGRSLREIALELGLSEKTIGTYRARLAEKLGLSSAVELTRYAVRNGLVD